MTTELKPCPFCAGPAEMIRPMGDRVFNWDTQGRQVPPYYGPRCFRLVCANEDCHVVTRACPTEREAIAAWNTRAPAALEPQAVDDAMVGRAHIKAMVFAKELLDRLGLASSDEYAALTAALQSATEKSS